MSVFLAFIGMFAFPAGAGAILNALGVAAVGAVLSALFAMVLVAFVVVARPVQRGTETQGQPTKLTKLDKP